MRQLHTEGSGSGGGEPRHGVRIAIAWAILTVIAVPLVIWVAGPHIPPYPGHSVQSGDQHTVNVVLLTLSIPIIALIWVYFGYAISFFRQRGPEIVDGPPLTADPRIQITWLVVTSIMVLGLAAYGTIGLLQRLARRRRRPGAEPAVHAACRIGPATGPGDRPAVAVDVPVSRLRRSGDGDAGDPGQPRGWRSTSPRWTSTTASGRMSWA